MRNVIRRLWHDEGGAVLSAEAVVVGTIAVVGLGAGMSTVSTAVNEELKEVAYAFRSLDQSYCIEGQNGCGSWTAGSAYEQPPVARSLRQLKAEAEKAERVAAAEARRQKQQLERKRKSEERTDKSPQDDGQSDRKAKKKKKRRAEQRRRSETRDTSPAGVTI